MAGGVEWLAFISFDSDRATRLAIHAPALPNPVSRVFQQAAKRPPQLVEEAHEKNPASSWNLVNSVKTGYPLRGILLHA